MSDISEKFWSASVEEIMEGYIYDAGEEKYICLVCGKDFSKGEIYKAEDRFFEAEKAVKLHIEKEHSSMFEYLTSLDKKLTGLTELQKNLLSYFYSGYSDSEIVKEIGGGSTSTIRNHRFTLREKEKQAKIFLAIMGLLEKKPSEKQKFITIHRSATMIDERYAITEEENQEILKRYFPQGLEGPLGEFPTREKRKIIILKHITKKFELDKKYTEKEVNEKLKEIFHDFVTIRRYLIEYGFMDRAKDCSQYWVKI